MNKNANVAAVIRLTRATTKAQRKRLSTSKVFTTGCILNDYYLTTTLVAWYRFLNIAQKRHLYTIQ